MVVAPDVTVVRGTVGTVVTGPIVVVVEEDDADPGRMLAPASTSSRAGSDPDRRVTATRAPRPRRATAASTPIRRDGRRGSLTGPLSAPHRPASPGRRRIVPLVPSAAQASS